MSLQDLPTSLGLLFTLPMKTERSRNKERLEASLAGLCELELLKQRQECRVLSALCLRDPPAPGRQAGGVRRSDSCAQDAASSHAPDGCGPKLQTSLQCTPWGIIAPLDQKVAELKVNAEDSSSADLNDNTFSSEVLFDSQDGSSNIITGVPFSTSIPGGAVGTETAETCLSDRRREAAVNDALGLVKDANTSLEDQQAKKLETFITELIQRRVLSTRPSKPRTSLVHDPRTVSVARQSSICPKEEKQSSKQMSGQEILSMSQYSEGTATQASQKLDQEHYSGTGFPKDAPPPYHHLQQSVQHQPGLYHKPRQASVINTSCSTSLEYSPGRGLQAQPDSSDSEPELSQHLYNYPSPLVLSTPHQLPSPDEQLVSAKYIPAQLCRPSAKSCAHNHSSPHKGSGVSKSNRTTYSPERDYQHHEQHSQIQPSRSRGGPKKCRSNEDRGGAIRKQGKKACRSQSENSLQRVPERKYNTVERDGGGSGAGGGAGGAGGRGNRSSQSRSKKHPQGSGSYRRWQSSQELSQDEADQPPTPGPTQNSSALYQKDHWARRTRKSRSTHASYAYPHQSPNHHHSHQHEHMEYQLEKTHESPCQHAVGYTNPGPGESDSSMSEVDSPDSSTLSSDSDESGGLVWPHQLPPQLYHPSHSAPPGAPLQHKAFVKIKASHALKKKILRFRTGSLKVMTTV